MIIEHNTNYAYKLKYEYNTCPHLCEYCYANASKEVALKNWEQAKETEWKSETITGIRATNIKSSVMTDKISPIAIGELQDAENQTDDNSAIVIAEF